MVDLLCIGFDGLDHREWDRRLANKLPAYRFAPLHSPMPVSGPAWTSLYTGLSAEEHGVTDLWGRPLEGSKYFADVRNACAWSELHRHGLSCALCNLPCTSPPSEVLPFHVGGFPQGDPFRYPYDLDLPPHWKQWSDPIWWSGNPTPNGWAPVLRKWDPETVRQRAQADVRSLIRWFVEHGGPEADFGWIAFTFPDRLLHLWPGEEWVHEFNAKLVLQAITRLTALCQPNAILVLSDHGFVEHGQPGQFNHTEQGILAWWGLGLSPGVSRDVTQVAKIILRHYLEGVPHKEEAPAGLDDGERRELESRLKALGYFD